MKRIYENISNNKIEFIPDQRIRPIFIVGLPRSGTTLIESIICQSNKVRRFGELPDFNIAFKKYFLERIKKKSDINYIESDSANKVINSYSNKFKSIDSYFTDKLPLNFMYIGLLEKFFPKSKIILCQRDKNDNLLSIYETFFTDNNYAFSYSTEDLKQYYMLYIEQINFWKKNKAKFCEIKYEDLVRNSESSIKNVCNFLDLTYTNELLDFHNKKNSVLTASNYQVRQKIYQNSVGKFNYYKDLLNFE